MFFEVLSPIYHSPITIQSLTYRVLLGTLAYSASAPPLLTKNRIAPAPRLQRLPKFGESFAGANVPVFSRFATVLSPVAVRISGSRASRFVAPAIAHLNGTAFSSKFVEMATRGHRSNGGQFTITLIGCTPRD
jgi:hypothetical protein